MLSLKGLLFFFFGLLSHIFVLGSYDLTKVHLDTKIDCSPLKEGVVRIRLTSDADVKATVFCQNSNFTYSMDKDKVTLDLILTTHWSEQLCQMHHVPEKKIYEVDMSVYRIFGSLNQNLKTFRMVCEEDSTTKAHVSIDVNNPFQDPHIIEDFYNEDTFIDMDLEVRNIYGNKMEKLIVYRKVQLYANAPLNYTGVQARECIMKTNEEIAILKGGCGTGRIFSKKTGFTTNGTSVISSFFLIPSMVSPTASFSCKFRICSSNCDGNSCVYKN